MNIIVSGKGVSISESMRGLLESKLGRLQKFWSGIVRAHVEVTRDRHHKHGDVFLVYGWLEIPGNDIRATALAGEFSEAVNLLYGKLERMVLKSKGMMSRQ